jgi:hypothetical protein
MRRFAPASPIWPWSSDPRTRRRSAINACDSAADRSLANCLQFPRTELRRYQSTIAASRAVGTNASGDPTKSGAPRGKESPVSSVRRPTRRSFLQQPKGSADDVSNGKHRHQERRSRRRRWLRTFRSGDREGDPESDRSHGRRACAKSDAGRPLAGALVKLTNLENDASPFEMHLTDHDGRANLTMPKSGTWLLNVIWTKSLPRSEATDFETVFSSLSFGFPSHRPQCRSGHRTGRLHSRYDGRLTCWRCALGKTGSHSNIG